MKDHFDRVLVGLALFVAVIVLGTVGYVVLLGWSALDAFYMTVIAVTTVGFREVRPLGTTGILLTIAVILSGVGLALYILTSFVAAIIEGDLRDLFGQRRMRMNIERLENHYIVCGYGRVGAEVCEELRARNAPFVVVDKAPESVERAREAGYLALIGDAASEVALEQAGVKRARALIAATDSDAGNIFIVLTAGSSPSSR